MNDNSSNGRNIGCVGRTNDRYDESTSLTEIRQAVHETPRAATNWAWINSNQSYDWMDSHSPFTTQDTFH